LIHNGLQKKLKPSSQRTLECDGLPGSRVPFDGNYYDHPSPTLLATSRTPLLEKKMNNSALAQFAGLDWPRKRMLVN
jgi:hypothetical protein